mmetsp:Transcript_4549/g.11220  ORF Transcript_4549/g.11220 Transcript_4549/m.11220 type:complete len:345 (+) Transcript_4549:398-1432(+)
MGARPPRAHARVRGCRGLRARLPRTACVHLGADSWHRGGGGGRAMLQHAVHPLVKDDVVLGVVSKCQVVEVARVRGLVHQLPLARSAQRLVLLAVLRVAVVPEHDDADPPRFHDAHELVQAVWVVHVDEHAVAHEAVVRVGGQRPRILHHVVRVRVGVDPLGHQVRQHLGAQVHAVEGARPKAARADHLRQEPRARAHVQHVLALGGAELKERVHARLGRREAKFLQRVVLVRVRPGVVRVHHVTLGRLEAVGSQVRALLGHCLVLNHHHLRGAGGGVAGVGGGAGASAARIHGEHRVRGVQADFAHAGCAAGGGGVCGVHRGHPGRRPAPGAPYSVCQYPEPR